MKTVHYEESNINGYKTSSRREDSSYVVVSNNSIKNGESTDIVPVISGQQFADIFKAFFNN